LSSEFQFAGEIGHDFWLLDQLTGETQRIESSHYYRQLKPTQAIFISTARDFSAANLLVGERSFGNPAELAKQIRSLIGPDHSLLVLQRV
jgi:hypothetical protein